MWARTSSSELQEHVIKQGGEMLPGSALCTGPVMVSWHAAQYKAHSGAMLCIGWLHAEY